MKNKTILFSLFALLVVGLISSCGEDPKDPITGEALFTYNADGYTVTFTNTSTISGGSVTHLWEFGDGETSTEKDPVHTYAGKGEYSVTLTETDADGGTHTITTRINVDKKTRIFLDDNSLDDWNDVTEDKFRVTLGDNSGVIKSLTFDYDAKYLYTKLVFEGTIQDSVIFNVFLDTDNDLTGFSSHLWPLLGVDYLLQGQVGIGAASWLGTFNYVGMDHGWGWEEQSLAADYYVMGTVVENAGEVTYEIGFDRAKIPGLDGDAVKLAIYLSDKGWAEIGFAPDKTEEGGDPQDGFTVIMN